MTFGIWDLGYARCLFFIAVAVLHSIHVVHFLLIFGTSSRCLTTDQIHSSYCERKCFALEAWIRFAFVIFLYSQEETDMIVL